MTSREGNTRSARHSASSQHRSCYLFLGISWQAAANSLGLLEKEKKTCFPEISNGRNWGSLSRQWERRGRPVRPWMINQLGARNKKSDFTGWGPSWCFNMWSKIHILINSPGCWSITFIFFNTDYLLTGLLVWRHNRKDASLLEV